MSKNKIKGGKAFGLLRQKKARKRKVRDILDVTS